MMTTDEEIKQLRTKVGQEVMKSYAGKLLNAESLTEIHENIAIRLYRMAEENGYKRCEDIANKFMDAQTNSARKAVAEARASASKCVGCENPSHFCYDCAAKAVEKARADERRLIMSQFQRSGVVRETDDTITYSKGDFIKALDEEIELAKKEAYAKGLAAASTTNTANYALGIKDGYAKGKADMQIELQYSIDREKNNSYKEGQADFARKIKKVADFAPNEQIRDKIFQACDIVCGFSGVGGAKPKRGRFDV